MTKLFRKLFSIESLISKEGKLGEFPPDREVYKNLITIALPSVCEMVLISLIGSIDTMMVGTIGTAAIASVGLVGQPRMLILCIFFALNIGVTAVVARRKGQGDREDANRTLRTALIMILALSAVMMTLGLTFSRQLMRLAGAKADTIDDAETYFRVLTWILPLNAISMAICAAQRGVGNTRLTMYVNITSNLVNVLFNWLLINGVWIFPRWGVKGAAVATAIGIAVGTLFAIISLFTKRRGDNFLQVSVKDNWKPSMDSARAVGTLGGNAMLEQLALRVGFFLFARIVAELGTQAYAAHQICCQFLNISFTFADGVGVAGTSLVGQMLGKQRSDLAHVYGKVAQRLALAIGLTIASLFAIFRFPLLSLFTREAAVLRISSYVMLVVAVFQPFQMVSVVTSGALRGAGDTKYVARVMLLCVAIIRPTAALLAVTIITRAIPATATPWGFSVSEWALIGVWAASLLDMTLRMTLALKRFNGGKWHAIKV